MTNESILSTISYLFEKQIGYECGEENLFILSRTHASNTRIEWNCKVGQMSRPTVNLSTIVGCNLLEGAVMPCCMKRLELELNGERPNHALWLTKSMKSCWSR